LSLHYQHENRISEWVKTSEIVWLAFGNIQTTIYSRICLQ